ncbi:hypothetical protein B4135_3604 [Caldibacillus debilis]|uniref:Uncharacterized protein n=1 Tax=Caldibacillus debilis TaxID=301148 RepID=A0A150LD02_9BACI|nr:hypothetical protein B4135_3604 [Caldibacillus debilis]
MNRWNKAAGKAFGFGIRRGATGPGGGKGGAAAPHCTPGRFCSSEILIGRFPAAFAA